MQNIFLILCIISMASCYSNKNLLRKCIENRISQEYYENLSDLESYLIDNAVIASKSPISLKAMVKKIQNDSAFNKRVKVVYQEYGLPVPSLADTHLIEACCRDNELTSDYCKKIIYLSEYGLTIENISDVSQYLNPESKPYEKGVILWYLYYSFRSI